ncbi:MAG: hypothetical protein HN580_02355 [Deltaproteobacteria bacterium]|mgnify:FL=1|jgi:hypothetical protein|nr:hypothetical protein [Deltaproteobacteria bacterium]MBT4640136.1 hypothetical protein [Deltaproteobacteria bacterium]MBT6504450.1 hypothetical protein [Deltaproteobacteria bacterium]MBT7153590.1 hypothetical protein [Deltaproteobacteria bacterium]MBT7710958.1 hypothetical protein [Deltaproteobacteria bacterium]
MSSLIKFRDVSLFKDKDFGIIDVSFDIQKRKKIHFTLATQEKLKTLQGLIEGRFQPGSGIARRSDRIFIQSDRLLLGDKIYTKNAGNWLKLQDEFFYFDGKRRSKRTFLNELNARHIRHFPIYRLKGEDRIKFTLLALTFQETGLLLISNLLSSPLSSTLAQHLERLVNGTHCTLCLFSALDPPPNKNYSFLKNPNLEQIDLRSA